MISGENLITETIWQSPSNIALIKYWGKKGDQLPANPSLSMCLKKSFTQMHVSLLNSEAPPFLEFYFNGAKDTIFEPRIRMFLEKTRKYFPFTENQSLRIESSNTFPHSSGIASSASAFSALTLCLLDMKKDLDCTEPDFFKKASEIARIGSGSASRSVYGGFSIWGKNDRTEGSSDFYAVQPDFRVHNDFSELQDAILLVSSEKKSVSSSAGHLLMNNHPFAEARYKLANKNLEELIDALKSGNQSEFIRIVEHEALILHSLLMSSDPGVLLLHSGSIDIIRKIRKYREESSRFICFTLDAGPNVHVIYRKSDKKEISDFISKELATHCENNKIIWDEAGSGPSKIKSKG